MVTRQNTQQFAAPCDKVYDHLPRHIPPFPHYHLIRTKVLFKTIGVCTQYAVTMVTRQNTQQFLAALYENKIYFNTQVNSRLMRMGQAQIWTFCN